MGTLLPPHRPSVTPGPGLGVALRHCVATLRPQGAQRGLTAPPQGRAQKPVRWARVPLPLHPERKAVPCARARARRGRQTHPGVPRRHSGAASGADTHSQCPGRVRDPHCLGEEAQGRREVAEPGRGSPAPFLCCNAHSSWGPGTLRARVAQGRQAPRAGCAHMAERASAANSPQHSQGSCKEGPRRVRPGTPHRWSPAQLKAKEDQEHGRQVWGAHTTNGETEAQRSAGAKRDPQRPDRQPSRYIGRWELGMGRPRGPVRGPGQGLLPQELRAGVLPSPHAERRRARHACSSHRESGQPPPRGAPCPGREKSPGRSGRFWVEGPPSFPGRQGCPPRRGDTSGGSSDDKVCAQQRHSAETVLPTRRVRPTQGAGQRLGLESGRNQSRLPEARVTQSVAALLPRKAHPRPRGLLTGTTSHRVSQPAPPPPRPGPQLWAA